MSESKAAAVDALFIRTIVHECIALALVESEYGTICSEVACTLNAMVTTLELEEKQKEHEFFESERKKADDRFEASLANISAELQHSALMPAFVRNISRRSEGSQQRPGARSVPYRSPDAPHGSKKSPVRRGQPQSQPASQWSASLPIPSPSVHDVVPSDQLPVAREEPVPTAGTASPSEQPHDPTTAATATTTTGSVSPFGVQMEKCQQAFRDSLQMLGSLETTIDAIPSASGHPLTAGGPQRTLRGEHKSAVSPAGPPPQDGDAASFGEWFCARWRGLLAGSSSGSSSQPGDQAVSEFVKQAGGAASLLSWCAQRAEKTEDAPAVLYLWMCACACNGGDSHVVQAIRQSGLVSSVDSVHLLGLQRKLEARRWMTDRPVPLDRTFNLYWYACVTARHPQVYRNHVAVSRAAVSCVDPDTVSKDGWGERQAFPSQEGNEQQQQQGMVWLVVYAELHVLGAIYAHFLGVDRLGSRELAALRTYWCPLVESLVFDDKLYLRAGQPDSQGTEQENSSSRGVDPNVTTRCVSLCMQHCVGAKTLDLVGSLCGSMNEFLLRFIHEHLPGLETLGVHSYRAFANEVLAFRKRMPSCVVVCEVEGQPDQRQVFRTENP